MGFKTHVWKVMWKIYVGSQGGHSASLKDFIGLYRYSVYLIKIMIDAITMVSFLFGLKQDSCYEGELGGSVKILKESIIL